MKKYSHIIIKIIFSLILLMPVLGSLGIFPAPTRDLYNSDAAFEFIVMLMNTAWYINVMMAVVSMSVIILLWTRREALAALLITPITANIVGFHLFLDGGLFTAGAVMANVLLLSNIYFLYKNKDVYKVLLQK